MGFSHTIALVLWPGYVAFGILSISVLYGWIGFLLFCTVNLALAYYLNQARKHGLAEKYDDRLSGERMEEAREWLIQNGGDRRIVET